MYPSHIHPNPHQHTYDDVLEDLQYGSWISVNEKVMSDVFIIVYTCRQLTFNRLGSPFSTLTRYNCFISFSKRLGRPGYMVEPPDNTMCLYKSARISISADWIVSNRSSTCNMISMLDRHFPFFFNILTCHAFAFDINEMWLEQTFRCFESLGANLDHSTVRKLSLIIVSLVPAWHLSPILIIYLIGLYKCGGLVSKLLIHTQVVADIAELLFELSHGLKISGTVECITTAQEQINQVSGDVTTCYIQSACQVRWCIALVDRNLKCK